jgi:hypothetical protein
MSVSGTVPSIIVSSVLESTGWPAIPGRSDEEHALVAIEAAARLEDIGLKIESKENHRRSG